MRGNAQRDGRSLSESKLRSYFLPFPGALIVMLNGFMTGALPQLPAPGPVSCTGTLFSGRHFFMLLIYETAKKFRNNTAISRKSPNNLCEKLHDCSLGLRNCSFRP